MVHGSHQGRNVQQESGKGPPARQKNRSFFFFLIVFFVDGFMAGSFFMGFCGGLLNVLLVVLWQFLVVFTWLFCFRDVFVVISFFFFFFRVLFLVIADETFRIVAGVCLKLSAPIDKNL